MLFKDLVEKNGETVVLFKDIVEKNGKTVEQNNLDKGHKYPIGTLVRFNLVTRNDHQSSVTTRGCLYVMEHTRDCDGSLLYDLGNIDISDDRVIYDTILNRSDLSNHVKKMMLKGLFDMVLNMGEDSLWAV